MVKKSYLENLEKHKISYESYAVLITLNKTLFKYIDLPWRYKDDRYGTFET